MSIALISHHDCLLHRVASHHPEVPDRLAAIDDQLIASGIGILLRHYDAPLVTREQLERVHDVSYLDFVERSAPQDQEIICLDQGDTCLTEHSLTAASRAAGAPVLGVDLVMSKEAESVFCNVRPPGHHAERARAMGFCVYNNIAVGAAHALEEYKLSRVAVIDFDVHHGNGTEDIFRNDPRVLFCSTFQHPFYPHTGADTQTDHIVNVPLPGRTDGQAFREAVSQHWLPRLEAFAPELIMISAGFDAHREDEMSDFRLVEADYGWVTTELKKIAKRHAQGRIVSSLEGGYSLSALGRSVVAHIDALIGH
ncbi:histone deacetylase family protein [Thiorhodospira sibirica]|uniref:histone deacetylase family protein n=1 Tax=Thiorhodospira sibirica TaxID=154347 RepID=UPI00022C1D06|nr:histone deacetylase family protein [Thiorhodospira sibirica]